MSGTQNPKQFIFIYDKIKKQPDSYFEYDDPAMRDQIFAEMARTLNEEAPQEERDRFVVYKGEQSKSDPAVIIMHTDPELCSCCNHNPENPKGWIIEKKNNECGKH